MNRPAILLFLVCAPVGLAGPRVDLSGPWKWHAGDDIRYAQPDWDDAGWESRTLPRASSLVGYSWYRRSVQAPAEGSEWALALGSLSQCYEVYANGTFLGSATCEENGDPAFRIPRVFRLPKNLAGPGKRLVIALRTEGRVVRFATAAARLKDQGPYVITDPESASTEVRLAHLALIRAATPMVLFGWTNFVMASLLFGLWATRRERLELLWFALHQGTLGVLNLWQAYTVSAGSAVPPAFTWMLPASYLFTCYATYVVAKGRNVRLMTAATFALAIGGARILLPGPSFQLVGTAIFGWLGFTGLRSASRADRGFCIIVLAYMLAGFNSVFSRMFPDIWPVPGAFTGAGFEFNAVSAVNMVLAGGMFLLLTIRMASERRKQQRLIAEFDAARTVQRMLLPGSDSAGDFTVDAAYEPALEVGGDFYQIARRKNGRCLVLVGDVSGKGLEAAMLASVAVGAFRSTESDSPAELLTIMNRALCGHGRSGFVTCICACFDPSGKLVIANAGHPSGYGDGQELPSEPALPLGMDPEAEFTECAVAIPAVAVFLSDGVVEAANAVGELFGFERTREISMKSAAEIAEAARAWGQNDDITVVTVRRTA